jgi:hypothetical protein
MDNDTIERMVEEVDGLISEMEKWSDDRFEIAIELAGQLVEELNDIDTE